jgi:hypothetical protein
MELVMEFTGTTIDPAAPQLIVPKAAMNYFKSTRTQEGIAHNRPVQNQIPDLQLI